MVKHRYLNVCLLTVDHTENKRFVDRNFLRTLETEPHRNPNLNTYLRS